MPVTVFYHVLRMGKSFALAFDARLCFGGRGNQVMQSVSGSESEQLRGMANLSEAFLDIVAAGRAISNALYQVGSHSVTFFNLDLVPLETNAAILSQANVQSAIETCAKSLRDTSTLDWRLTLETAFKAITRGDNDAGARPFYYAGHASDGQSENLVCALAPVHSLSDEVVAVVCVSRRYDLRLDQQSLIADKEAMLSAILATVPDAMVVIDEYGHITSFSAAAQTLFGWTEAEILGRNINVLMPQPYSSAHDGYLQRYMQTGQKRIIGIGRVVEGQRRDGSVFPMELSIGEARTPNHRAFTGFVRDLTQRHETEAQLRKVQSELIHASRLSAVGTLASALAHELNQPLTAIANYTSTGRDMLGDDRPQTRDLLHEAFNEAAKEALRAGQIVRRLRDFVAKGELTRQILSLGDLIEDAMALGLVGARELGVSVEVNIDPEIDDVLADRVQIQQVMVNLFRNAMEAMGQSATKHLVVRAHSYHQNQVEISVCDTGHGISNTMTAQLFQPFVSTKAKGMGLGLSICRTIIEAHGGKLSVSGNPQGGTIFSFTLTRVSKDPQNDD
jgi:two-component system, LuxR family, sensor kinase FixL